MIASGSVTARRAYARRGSLHHLEGDCFVGQHSLAPAPRVGVCRTAAAVQVMPPRNDIMLFKQINASVREDESVWLPRYHLCSPVIVTDALVPGLCGAASRLRCNGLSRAVLISREGDFFGSFARRLQPCISWGGFQSGASFSVRLRAVYCFRLHISG